MSKYELSFDPPLLNAAGSLGFAPDPRGPLDLSSLGGFITNPISPEPRKPAAPPRMLSFPGGVLLHTGHPNPGIKAVIGRFSDRWAQAPLPVIVHLLAEDTERVTQAVHLLEDTEGVAGIELGLPPGIEVLVAQELVRAAVGELPVLARIGMDAARTFGQALFAAGASAVVLGPPRGSLPDENGNPVSGRLYGPALFALALESVRSLALQGIPVLAAGGAYRAQDTAALYSAGAAAVQLDTILWRGGWDVPEP